MISTTYIVLTPRGQFLAEWDEDEEIPVQYAGDPVAIDYFYDYMALEMVAGRGGLRLEPGYVEPDDLYGFCQSEKYGITVIPDTPPTPDDEGENMQEFDAATPEERKQLIDNGREIVGRLGEGSPSFFADARALRAITAELSESDAPADDAPGQDFSIQDVADAMKKTKGWDSAWWQDESIDAPLRFAQAQGWVRRPSTTQVEWTDAGVAALRKIEQSMPSATMTMEQMRARQQTLTDFIEAAPGSPNRAEWEKQLREISAAIGDAPPAESAASTKAKDVDTSSWSDAAKLAYALRNEYEGFTAETRLDSKKMGAFKRKIRMVAKSIPADDEKAVTLIDMLVTKVWGADYDPKIAEIEFRPAGSASVEANPDQTLLQSVIDGTADMASPALLDQLEAAYERIKDDPAMMELFNRAAEAYSNYAVQAAKKALG